MNTYEFTVSLRIRHPSLDPAEITRGLEMEPKNAWKAGAPRRTPGDEPLHGTYRETYWSAPLGEDSWRRSSPIALEPFLLNHLRLLGVHADFLKQLITDGGSCELFVGLAGRGEFGLEMPPSLLRLLADVHCTLTFDIYPDEQADG
ncbi:MAG TPA: DUF4279 domain-containing protein [Steroidobacteraceae bacterium]